MYPAGQLVEPDHADPHVATSRAVSRLVTPPSATRRRDHRRPRSEQVMLHLRQLGPANTGIDLIQPCGSERRSHRSAEDPVRAVPNRWRRRRRPARLVVEVARYLDMHPADLVAGLDTVLHHPRLHNRPEPADTDAVADVDALTVLTALATATAPLTIDQLADVLAWTIERVTTALDRATTTPQLAGPLALRHVAANTYTVTPRLDLLTGDERRRLHETARWNQPIDVEQANVLLAALVLRDNEYADQPGPTYAEWREGHLDTERELRVSGLLYADYKPQAPKINPEALYSLRCQETPHPNGH